MDQCLPDALVRVKTFKRPKTLWDDVLVQIPSLALLAQQNRALQRSVLRKLAFSCIVSCPSQLSTDYHSPLHPSLINAISQEYNLLGAELSLLQTHLRSIIQPGWTVLSDEDFLDIKLTSYLSRTCFKKINSCIILENSVNSTIYNNLINYSIFHHFSKVLLLTYSERLLPLYFEVDGICKRFGLKASLFNSQCSSFGDSNIVVCDVIDFVSNLIPLKNHNHFDWIVVDYVDAVNLFSLLELCPRLSEFPAQMFTLLAESDHLGCCFNNLSIFSFISFDTALVLENSSEFKALYSQLIKSQISINSDLDTMLSDFSTTFPFIYHNPNPTLPLTLVDLFDQGETLCVNSGHDLVDYVVNLSNNSHFINIISPFVCSISDLLSEFLLDFVELTTNDLPIRFQLFSFLLNIVPKFSHAERVPDFYRILMNISPFFNTFARIISTCSLNFNTEAALDQKLSQVVRKFEPLEPTFQLLYIPPVINSFSTLQSEINNFLHCRTSTLVKRLYKSLLDVPLGSKVIVLLHSNQFLIDFEQLLLLKPNPKWTIQYHYDSHDLLNFHSSHYDSKILIMLSTQRKFTFFHTICHDYLFALGIDLFASKFYPQRTKKIKHYLTLAEASLDIDHSNSGVNVSSPIFDLFLPKSDWHDVSTCYESLQDSKDLLFLLNSSFRQRWFFEKFHSVQWMSGQEGNLFEINLDFFPEISDCFGLEVEYDWVESNRLLPKLETEFAEPELEQNIPTPAVSKIPKFDPFPQLSPDTSKLSNFQLKPFKFTGKPTDRAIKISRKDVRKEPRKDARKDKDFVKEESVKRRKRLRTQVSPVSEPRKKKERVRRASIKSTDVKEVAEAEKFAPLDDYFLLEFKSLPSDIVKNLLSYKSCKYSLSLSDINSRLAFLSSPEGGEVASNALAHGNVLLAGLDSTMDNYYKSSGISSLPPPSFESYTNPLRQILQDYVPIGVDHLRRVSSDVQEHCSWNRLKTAMDFDHLWEKSIDIDKKT
ncbi:hypothetical protein P9112_002416 [Eukaryota sp. TZLM1-RC]